jgi:hypothetical protein
MTAGQRAARSRHGLPLYRYNGTPSHGYTGMAAL